MQESDPRFANLERKVGAFLVASLLVIAGVVGYTGVRQGLFTPKARLSFTDQSGRDLAPGMEVVTRGFRIGKVSRVELTDAGVVAVTLSIDRHHLKRIRRDSTARLLAKVVVGSGKIEISPGSPGAPPMAEGSVIPFERDPDLQDIAKRVMEDVKPVLHSVRSLIEYLDNPQGDIKTAIANVNRLTAGLAGPAPGAGAGAGAAGGDIGSRLNTLVGRLDAVTAALQKETVPKVQGLVEQGDALVREDLRGLTATLKNDLIPQVRGLLAEADKGVAGAGRTAAVLEGQLPGLLEKVNATLGNVQQITDNLVPLSREAGGMLATGEQTLEQSQELLKKTNQMWPFREGKPARETTIDVDSYRSPAPPAGAPAPRGR
jgi:phospholipid/cholesterol/gamma-HCH transport system substrate-binding protein